MVVPPTTMAPWAPSGPLLLPCAGAVLHGAPVSVWLELLVLADAPVPLPPLDEAVVAVTREPPPRLGADTVFHGDHGSWIEEAPYGLSLRLRRQDDDLQAAHGDAVAVLEQIASLVAADALAGERSGRLVVVDVFCLDARPIDAAIERLRSDAPEARFWLGLRPGGREGATTDEVFDVETFGLRKLGRREVHVLSVPRGLVAAVSRFIAKLCDYVAFTAAPLLPGDEVSFGWVDVQLRAAEGRAGYPAEPAACAPRFVRDVVAPELVLDLPGVLLVAEPEDDGVEPDYALGAIRAAGIVEQMLGAAAQCGLSEGVEVPRCRQTAVVCRQVRQGPPVEARRVKPDEPSASGWVVICQRADHDHEDADNFVVIDLLELMEWLPRLFSLLACPVGTGVVLGNDDAATILLPGED